MSSPLVSAAAVAYVWMWITAGALMILTLRLWLDESQPRNRRIPVFLDTEWLSWVVIWPLAIPPAYLERRLLALAA